MALYVARYMRRVRRPSVCRCREAHVGGLAATEYVHCRTLHRRGRPSAATHLAGRCARVRVPPSLPSPRRWGPVLRLCSARPPQEYGSPNTGPAPVVSSPSGEIALATDPQRKSVLRSATRELLAYNGPLALAALMTVWLSGAWIVYEILRGSWIVGFVSAAVWAPIVWVVALAAHRRGMVRLAFSLGATGLFLTVFAWIVGS